MTGSSVRVGLRALGIIIDNVNALLPNAVAVHLLNLGADVRLVAVPRLKEAHRCYHPAEQAHGSRVGGRSPPGGTLG